MKKIIKRLNNSIGITFNKEERKIYNIEVDDVVEITVEKLEKEGVF